jgi:ribosome-binding protein aMBF1 (putative translation factor)
MKDYIDMLMDVRDRLRRYKNETKLSILQISQKMEMNYWTLNKVYRGIGMSRLDTLKRIEDYLDIVEGQEDE